MSGDQPFSAGIDKKSDKDVTIAYVDFRGKRVLREFNGVGHLQLAKAYVVSWNSHLGQEWGDMQGAVAGVIEALMSSLLDDGVDPELIKKALKRIHTDGQV